MDFKLADAGLGAVEERFDIALSQLVENCMDPNTDPTKKRSIVIKFEYKPSKTDRGFGEMLTSVEPKLAPMAPLQTGLSVGIDTTTGETRAREHVQRGLFDDEEPARIDPIEEADNLAMQQAGKVGSAIPFRKQSNG